MRQKLRQTIRRGVSGAAGRGYLHIQMLLAKRMLFDINLRL